MKLRKRKNTTAESSEDYFKRLYDIDLNHLRNTDDPVWHMRYASHPHLNVVEEFAANNQHIRTFWIFKKFLNHEDALVREAMILNPALSDELLEQHVLRLEPTKYEADKLDYQAYERRKLAQQQ